MVKSRLRKQSYDHIHDFIIQCKALFVLPLLTQPVTGTGLAKQTRGKNAIALQITHTVALYDTGMEYPN